MEMVICSTPQPCTSFACVWARTRARLAKCRIVVLHGIWVREILTKKMLDPIGSRKISLSSARSIHRLTLVANDVGDAVVAIKTIQNDRVVSFRFRTFCGAIFNFVFRSNVSRQIACVRRDKKNCFSENIEKTQWQERRLKTCVKVPERIFLP